MTPFSHSSNLWYYLGADNRLLGPITIGGLDALFVEGVISLETRVIREFGKDFQPYGAVFTDSSLRDQLL